ncbi:MAG: hypothetical protein KatS3mg076_2446 [Candidatus Binatia bacterium]|nr:MAG: hypothetical protein KatS3mg076_2446 [Candidatus Binatia bacterium]
MVGIRSFGAYIPMFRLPLGVVSGGSRKAAAAGGAGEKAVANFDEDAVTMAVAAGRDCLEGIDREKVDALVFASTTYPYKEKQGAAVVAKALDLRRDVRTADFGGSIRAGTTAFRFALDSVLAGTAENVLVVAADCRMAAPRSALERNFGDAAAALLVAREGVVAEVVDVHSHADEIIDVWRTDHDTFVRSWEERFVVQHGYRDNVVEAVQRILAKTKLGPKDFDRVVLYAPDARSHAGVARSLGFDSAAQVVDPLFGRVGNAGAAFAPLLLALALESALPGANILWVNYGDGADAFVLRVTDAIGGARGRRAVSWHLERRAELADYDKYLRFRHLQPSEFDPRGGVGVSATVHYRDRNEDISFHGHRCRRCGTLQFPFQRVCYTCYARDEFDEVRLSDLKGRVMSYTFDFFAGSPDPPLIVTTVETEGGCRIYLQMTDANPKEVRLDLPVEFTFRKIHEYGGTPNYFWKCTPVR